ncbi:polycomb group protein EMF2B-like isoform X7 [Magnolia sinica]|uniref:polycomb group protein EMF2B-like isoform X7 n=1 Tax=Magnolia sinica TaxID=86752 RepID=UPI002659FBCE|nr:polycomb group protein EMF2B-like isoform X7 [Magnolia sinica]
MPGLPLVARETTNLGCNCSHSRTVEQMCHQDSRHLSVDEAAAAEESLSIYCKPVEFYNILQRRALQNPSFLQRCLHYKIQANRKRRIQMTISLGTGSDEVQVQNALPLYVLLAKPVSDITVAEHSAVYQLRRTCILKAYSEFGSGDKKEATFIIPELRKLSADGKAGNLTVLLVSYGEAAISSSESDLLKDQFDLASFPSKFEGHCLWGRLPMESLYSSWEKCASLSMGARAEILSTVEMHSGFLEPSCLDGDNCITIKIPRNSRTMNLLRQVQVNVLAQEVGAKERSPYDSYTYDVPTSSLSHIIRMRTGNVIFNYRYYNNTLQKTEETVTEDFSCPFCLVQCANFKGLRYHLTTSHDLFNYEFWVTEEYQAVNVSVKTDIWRSESVADGVDPRLQTFSFCSKPCRRRTLKKLVQNAKHVHPHARNSASPEVSREASHEGHLEKDAEVTETIASSSNVAGFCSAAAQASASNECVQPISANYLAPSSMLQFAKTRKISADRADPRNHALLQKRQFFHSHRAQPMTLDQVLSDRDSEDEVDDDIADFEDRRLLDDFVDVTKDEKQIMHLWNSFVRKQRVLADGHIPWACESFSRLHGRDLVRVPALIWCWRLFMIKLWNHSLLDARSMNNCNIILDSFRNESSDDKQS